MSQRYVVVDTSVLAHLTKSSAHTATYDLLLDSLIPAISFQTEAELLASDYGPSRQMRLNQWLDTAIHMPHSQLASAWYARCLVLRSRLRRQRTAGSDASDADQWIIANALEHGASLASHDAQQVALGRAIGLDVYTALPRLRAGNPA